MDINQGPVDPFHKQLNWYLLSAFMLIAGAAWLMALSGQSLVAQVSSLYELSQTGRPYFQPSEFGLLYIRSPIVVISSFIVFLTPGLMLVLALNQARNLPQWLGFGFPSALVLVIILGTLIKVFTASPVTSQTVLSLWGAVSIGLFLYLGYRLGKGVLLDWPLNTSIDYRRLLLCLVMLFIGIAVFTPKIFWENFNLDGVEAFEFSRSLTDHFLPHWELNTGVFGFYKNYMLFAYPDHWFITFFGQYEASTRLPFFLYLIVLYSSLVLVIEWKQTRPLSLYEDMALWLALIIFTIVQVYNATYEPFFADLSEPAAADTLWITCFILAFYALWRGLFNWFWILALMTLTASTGGLALLGATALMILITQFPEWRARLRMLAGIFAVWLVVIVIDEIYYGYFVMGGVGDQLSSFNVLRRLSSPSLTEFPRLNALIFPSGILPALYLFLARKRHPMSLVIAGVTLIYFVVIYLQAWTNLHQFTPVMVLPLVVFWRIYLQSSAGTKQIVLPTSIITAMIALYLSLPVHFQIDQSARHFGMATDYSIGDYNEDYQAALSKGSSLYSLLPEDYRLYYPEQPWGTDSSVWLYYASRVKPAGTVINYIIQPSTDPAPANTRLVSSENEVSVFVRDIDLWEKHRTPDIPRVVQSPLYEPIYRQTMGFFRSYAGLPDNKTH